MAENPNPTVEAIEKILAEALTSVGIQQWWDGEWECTCSVSHGTRRTFYALNPRAVLLAAEVWVDTLPEMDGR